MTRGKLLDTNTMLSFFISILMMTRETQKTDDRTDSRNGDSRKKTKLQPVEWESVAHLTFTELWMVSMEHLQRVWHANMERLPFRSPGSVPPSWGLLVLLLLNPDKSNLSCLYSTFHLQYPLVLSRSCLLQQ